MSTYKELVGKKIKAVSSDPSDSADGQMWYNTATQSLRGLALTSAWSSASQLGTGRYLTGGFGSQTAGVVTMGAIPPGASPQTITEHYDGTGWSNGTAYPTGGYSGGGAGTQTAGLLAGGTPGRTTAANEYDGSSWTSTGSVPVACDNFSLCGEGTQSNIIGAIGRTPATGNSGTNTSVTYNGSVFGSAPNLNTARMYGNHAGTGTGTAGLIFGGFIDPSPNAMTNCEEYDGSSWSNTGSLNVAGSFLNGFGTQSDTVTNVNTPNYAGTERYNGTSWTALPNMAVSTPGGLYGNAAGTSGTNGYLTTLGPTLAATEEFNESTNIITAAAWASGGNLNNARDEGASSQNGLQTAALYFGGYYTDPAVAYTEQYDGTSWTNKNNLNTARYSGAGAGTTTAALYSGGFSNPSTLQSAVEEFDGTNWATQPNSLSTGRYSAGGCGTQTAALVYGGATPTYQSATEAYNGTSWTAGGALSQARSQMSGGVGISTAAICVGGRNPPVGNFLTLTEEYGGSSWTSGGALLTGANNMGGAGTATDAIIFGGIISPGSPGYTGLTQGYDGTSFSTRPPLATSRNYISGTGTATAGVAFGGNSHPTYTTATEEFTGETTTANVETFSTS